MNQFVLGNSSVAYCRQPVTGSLACIFRALLTVWIDRIVAETHQNLYQLHSKLSSTTNCLSTYLFEGLFHLQSQVMSSFDKPQSGDEGWSAQSVVCLTTTFGGDKTTLNRCCEPGCGKSFQRPCDLTKHRTTHSRPWKCPEVNCNYHTFGWPTKVQMDRHFSDKHAVAPLMYRCHYHPCPYESKRESNCNQHMEKSHDWEYKRKRGLRKGDKAHLTFPASSPYLIATPTTQFSNQPNLSKTNSEDTLQVSPLTLPLVSAPVQPINIFTNNKIEKSHASLGLLQKHLSARTQLRVAELEVLRRVQGIQREEIHHLQTYISILEKQLHGSERGRDELESERIETEQMSHCHAAKRFCTEGNRAKYRLVSANNTQRALTVDFTTAGSDGDQNTLGSCKKDIKRAQNTIAARRSRQRK